MDENMVAKVIQKLFIFILISLKMLMRIWSIRFKINGDSKFIIKSHEPLAENRIKKEIKQLLYKYKHGNNIHEHGKQQNEWAT